MGCWISGFRVKDVREPHPVDMFREPNMSRSSKETEVLFRDSRGLNNRAQGFGGAPRI